MRLRFFGGFAVDGPDGAIPVRGRGQSALLFRLALEPGSTVRYRALAEDVWPDDLPEDPRASLQSLVSRMRRALPAGTITAAAGGYALTLDRSAVDLTAFQDLVGRARASSDPAEAATLAQQALDLWTGEPWTPSDGFDWVVSDLYADRGEAERIVAAAPAPGSTGGSSPATTAPAGPPAAVTPPVPGPDPSPVPAPVTALVGRLDELVLIAEQLAASRLVTLIGPGGAGKTTLALETARRQGGAIVAELAPASADEVWAAVASAVGRSFRIGETTALSSRERALEGLAGRTTLLVLDNCEHVSAVAAAVALDLLQWVPGLRLLATSREPLGLSGEAFVDLGPLPEGDAVELFTRRVRAARGRPVQQVELDAALSIVRRLDGLPLALELAAAKTRTMSLAEIGSGLDDRFALLASGPRAADPRHRTLRALIDWSWDLLTEPERVALLASAVLPDGLGATDAATVARHAGTTADAFDQLLDRSLLRRADGRFRMLETVREYGLDRLGAEGRKDDLRAAVARAMVEVAERQDALLHGPGGRAALGWFDDNEENLGAALRTTIGDPALRAEGIRLTRAWLWASATRERFEEIQPALQAFADLDSPVDSEAAVVVHCIGLLMAVFAIDATDGPAREPGDCDGPPGTTTEGPPPAITPEQFAARAATLVAAAERFPTDLSLLAPPLLQAAAHLLVTRRPGDAWSTGLEMAPDDPGLPPWTRAMLALMRSGIAQNSGHNDVLGVESERALTLFRRLGDTWGIAAASQLRSEWLILAGRLEEALAIADAATEDLAGLSTTSDILQQRTMAIQVLTRLDRLDEARARAAEVLALAEADGSDRTMLVAVIAAAAVEVAVGDGEAALGQLTHLPPQEIGPGGFDQFVALSGSLRARALVLAGRFEEARSELAGALPAALRAGDQPILADALLTLATWFEAAGSEGRARHALAQSVRVRGGFDATDPTIRRLVARVGAVPVAPDDGDLAGLIALDP